MGELLTKFEKQLAAVKVIPSEGGRFEISFDGELIYSKLATHHHPEPGEVARLIAERLEKGSTT
jgi:selenoprotein W-related protein